MVHSGEGEDESEDDPPNDHEEMAVHSLADCCLDVLEHGHDSDLVVAEDHCNCCCVAQEDAVDCSPQNCGVLAVFEVFLLVIFVPCLVLADDRMMWDAFQDQVLEDRHRDDGHEDLEEVDLDDCCGRVDDSHWAARCPVVCQVQEDHRYAGLVEN